MTFKEFINSKCKIPTPVFCQVYGIPDDNILSPCVWVYGKGYHIEDKNSEGNYRLELDRSEYESPDLELLEKKLWKEFVVWEENPDQMIAFSLLKKFYEAGTALNNFWAEQQGEETGVDEMLTDNDYAFSKSFDDVMADVYHWVKAIDPTF